MELKQSGSCKHQNEQDSYLGFGNVFSYQPCYYCDRMSILDDIMFSDEEETPIHQNEQPWMPMADQDYEMEQDSEDYITQNSEEFTVQATQDNQEFNNQVTVGHEDVKAELYILNEKNEKTLCCPREYLQHAQSTSFTTPIEQQNKFNLFLRTAYIGTAPVPTYNQNEEIKAPYLTQPFSTSRLNQNTVQSGEERQIFTCVKTYQTFKSTLGLLLLFKLLRDYLSARFQEFLYHQYYVYANAGSLACNQYHPERSILDLYQNEDFKKISEEFLAYLKPNETVPQFENYDELFALLYSGQGKKEFKIDSCKNFRDALIKQSKFKNIEDYVFESPMFKLVWPVFAADNSFKFDKIFDEKWEIINSAEENSNNDVPKTILSISYQEAGLIFEKFDFNTPVHWNAFVSALYQADRNKGIPFNLQTH